VENCQLGVFLVYATPRGHTYLDRELYLPQRWTDDCERCWGAGIPDDVAFQTKPHLAQAMLKRAVEAGVPLRWLTAGCIYGMDPSLRQWLEAQPLAYVLAVRKDTSLAVSHTRSGVWRESVQTLAVRLPAEAWQRLSAGAAAKGPAPTTGRSWSWPNPRPLPGSKWLLVRRSLGESPQFAYYRVCAPAATPLAAIA
jgi:SRSO17 transposase